MDEKRTGSFYVTVVQVILLFGLETCVVTPHIVRTLGGFYHWVVRRIAVKLPYRWQDGGWDYPMIVEAL